MGSAATLVARCVTPTGVGALLELLHLRLGRLVPPIVGHLLVDALLNGGFAIHAAF